MKIQQKLLAVLMVIVMLAAMVAPMTVSAAETADNGISITMTTSGDLVVDGTITVSVYFTGENIKSMMLTPKYDENILTPVSGRWRISDDTEIGDDYLSDLAELKTAWNLETNEPPAVAFSKAVTLENEKLLEFKFTVKSTELSSGENVLVSFKEVNYALMVGGLETSYSSEDNPELVTLEPYVVTVSCDHDYAINRYTGLMTCSVCNEVCPHDVWTSSVCEACGLECTHDWTYSGTTATCAICGAKCTSHAKKGLFLDCATCGYDMELANSYYKGDSQITDTGLTLQTAHGFKLNTQLTVGSAETIFNIKDTARDDNVYYSAVENTTGSDYFSLITWIFTLDGASGATYRSLVSLWLDTTNEFSSKVNGETPDGFVAPKLWLTAPNNSSQKICEIKAGETYDLTLYYEVKWGWSLIEVRQNGELIASYTANGNDFSGTLTSSKIRLGESATAKKIHIQKISFEDVIFSDTYEKGVCRVCGAECAHRYNVGGYCADCGVLGDSINYSDYVGTCGLVAQAGIFKQNGGSTYWQFFDDTGILFGHDYVYEMDFKFTENIYDSANTNGTTRFLIWADNNSAETTGQTRFGLRLIGNTSDGTVLLGFKDDFTVNDAHAVINMNQKYSLRVAVRSTPSATAGTYDHYAEVSLDGKLIYTQTFQLNLENGMSIRLGDHVRRQTQAKYEVDSNFGIHFLDDTIEYIGAQEQENADYSADENFDIRFVFGFDDLYLEDVGVKVEAAVSDGTTGTKVLSADGKALTAVAVNGVTKKIGVNGIGYGGYYMAAAITGIELDTSKTYTFTLTPYLKGIEAEEVTYMDYSYEITVTFDENDKMVIDYDKIA